MFLEADVRACASGVLSMDTGLWTFSREILLETQVVWGEVESEDARRCGEGMGRLCVADVFDYKRFAAIVTAHIKRSIVWCAPVDLHL